MLEARGCAICGSAETKGQGSKHGQFSVDHDHSCCPDRTKSCGKCVRGLLCNHCNVILGFAKDNPDLLIAAAAYLVSLPSCPEGDEMEVEVK